MNTCLIFLNEFLFVLIYIFLSFERRFSDQITVTVKFIA